MSERTDHAAQFLDAYNNRDWDTMKGLCAENVTYYDNALGAGGARRDDLINFWKAWTEALSDERVFDIDYIEDEAKGIVITPLTFQGTHDGDDYLPGLKANGKESAIRCCTIWRFDADNKITSHEYFWDLCAPLVELGHLPQPFLRENLKQATQIPPKVGAHY
ncbi:nuclear transport factor 2 family protein [Streptomyces sp. NPDC005574]|uniref:ester cyclase n=1 Tax=Streptomyces sp. NPDC005574 TaxID=3156891 RepID=UPI0033BA00F0